MYGLSVFRDADECRYWTETRRARVRKRPRQERLHGLGGVN
jgi:hypothetical protein